MKLPYFLLPVLFCLPVHAQPASSPEEVPPVAIPVEEPPVAPAAALANPVQQVTGDAGADDIGRFLAGLPVRQGAILSRFQMILDYQKYRREMAEMWTLTERARMEPMRAWTAAELPPAVANSGTVYYPFGGPDLLYVNALFPKARTYVLMGLEPVGEVPALESMSPDEVLSALPAFRKATHTHLGAGFFITKDMREDLENKKLGGVTPILLSTVAFIGGQVESVGSISAGGNPGVEVNFQDAAGARHKAIYVSGDLSNPGFSEGFREWLAGTGGSVTYFKAASYLMVDDRFSQAREFFLTRSKAVLQDDSGIPFHYFAKDWSFRFFGNYEQPIKLFMEYQQADLRRAFAENPKGPLTFGSGYQIEARNGNLLLATKE